MTVVLAATELTCRVAGRAIVDDVSLEVSAGERVALLGPSGSGKTTLLTALGGLTRLTAGTVAVTPDAVDDAELRLCSVALVFQTYGLVSLLSAAENVELALRAAGMPPDDAVAASTTALQDLAVERFAEHLIDELSGGQQQRVAVARALALRPAVLLADEPTAEQDAQHRDVVLRRLLAVAESGVALVVATHDDDVADRCDRVVEMRDGRLTRAGTIRAVP